MAVSGAASSSGTISTKGTVPITVVGKASPGEDLVFFGDYYSSIGAHATPYEEAIKAVKPRITRIKTFVTYNYGTNWQGVNDSIEFESWQKGNPNRLIVSCHPVWNSLQNRIELIVVYSEEL